MMMINQQERQEIRQQQVKEEPPQVKVQQPELQVEPIKQRKNEFYKYIITIRLNYPSNKFTRILINNIYYYMFS